MFIPLILYEGGMYRYDYQIDKPHVEKINFIRFVSQGIPEAPIPVFIDVVDIEYFSDYLILIENELNAM